MGIYIKGMKMPKFCLMCPCAGFEDLDNENGEYWKCEVTGSEITKKEYTEQVLPDCPLVPVPPHGRCIDADEFFKALTMDDRVSILEAMHVQSILSDAPTIIPAEED